MKRAVVATLAFAFACKHPAPPNCSALTPPSHATYKPSNVFGEPSCAMTCDPGWLDCDQSESSGCETSAIGRAPHTVIEIGSFTACTTGCEKGFSDCDGDLQNGCESDAACTHR